VKLSSLVQGRALAVRIPRHVKAALLNDLANLLPTGDRQADYRIEKALASITTSLDNQFWFNDAHLSRTGHRVFTEDERAVQTLLEAQTRVTGVAAVADGLVTRGDIHNFFIVIVYRWHL
jgi:hypothetical protein